MSATTRRGLLAGAATGLAVPRLAAAATTATTEPKARRAVVRRGRDVAVSANGRRLLVAHDQRHTVGIVVGGRTRVVDVGGEPVGVAVSPDGTLGAVTTGFWDHPGLVVLDLLTAEVVARRAIGAAPGDVAFTEDGRRLVVAGGEQEGTVTVLETRRFTKVATARPGRVPRAVAVVPGRPQAWVTLNADDRSALVDLRSGRVVRVQKTPALPDRIAVAPDGEFLLITHGGRHASRVTELDLVAGKLHRHEVGREPSAVAWTHHGKRLVALGGDAAVQQLGGRRHPVGAAPRGLAVAGRRFWTVSALTAEVSGGRA